MPMRRKISFGWYHLFLRLEIWVLTRVGVKVFNATFNNISVISWQPVLLVEKTEVSGENHRPTAIILYRVHLAWVGFELTMLVVIDTDWIDLCLSKSFDWGLARIIDKKYNTFGTFPKYNSKFTELEAKSTPLTHIHDRPLSFLGRGTTTKRGGIELVLWVKVVYGWSYCL